MKPTVYIETTIVSYLTAWPSRDVLRQSHELLTRRWWDHQRSSFELRTSAYTIAEASAGDVAAAKDRLDALRGIPLLEVTDTVEELAGRLVTELALPLRARTDAFHVAVTAVHNVQFLLTWNCRHLANGMLTSKIESACRLAGWRAPQILTPEMLMRVP